MKVKKGFQLRDICGEKVIIAEGLENMDFSKLISVNESAAFLWSSISKMSQFDANILTSLLLKEYDISETEARRDVQKLIEDWISQGIIE